MGLFYSVLLPVRFFRQVILTRIFIFNMSELDIEWFYGLIEEVDEKSRVEVLWTIRNDEG